MTPQQIKDNKMTAIEFFKYFGRNVSDMYISGVISFNGERQIAYFGVDKNELREVVAASEVTQYDSIEDIESFISCSDDDDLYEVAWTNGIRLISKPEAKELVEIIKKINN